MTNRKPLFCYLIWKLQKWLLFGSCEAALVFVSLHFAEQVLIAAEQQKLHTEYNLIQQELGFNASKLLRFVAQTTKSAWKIIQLVIKSKGLFSYAVLWTVRAAVLVRMRVCMCDCAVRSCFRSSHFTEINHKDGQILSELGKASGNYYIKP